MAKESYLKRPRKGVDINVKTGRTGRYRSNIVAKLSEKSKTNKQKTPKPENCTL